ncbi:BA14K family protein [Afipia sp. TerB]
MKRGIAASLGAALLVASTAVSGAAPLSPAAVPSTTNSDSNIVNVRWRGHRHHHHGWRRHHWHRRHYGWGPAFGGFAAGALIGSAIASSNARANDAVAYCMNRFKSYDPASGTYLGYDGIRHPCP